MNWHLGIILSLASALAVPLHEDAQVVLPPDAQAVLNGLPEQALTLDYVIIRARSSSASYRAIEAEKTGFEAPSLAAQAVLDPRISLTGTRLLNENDIASPFTPNQVFSTSSELGVSWFLPTGTTLSGSITQGVTTIGFQSAAGFSYYETVGTLGISQNLWRDAFGNVTRKGLEAGDLLTEANRYAQEEAAEAWLESLVGVYYQAWLSQARSRAARSGLKRRERLLEASLVKLARGTAERPEILQIESAVLQSGARNLEAKHGLSEIWRHLIATLALPTEWMAIDPDIVPVKIEMSFKDVEQACGPESGVTNPPARTALTDKIEKQAMAARLAADRAHDAMRPEALLSAAVSSNGIDATFGTAFNETSGLDHPAWTVAFTLKFPLFQSAEESVWKSTESQAEKLMAFREQALSNSQVDWLNACADFHRLRRSEMMLEGAFVKQVERSKLEEIRFRNGLIPVVAVIQSGDDTTEAELAFYSTQASARVSAWKVRRLHGDAMGVLERGAQ